MEFMDTFWEGLDLFIKQFSGCLGRKESSIIILVLQGPTWRSHAPWTVSISARQPVAALLCPEEGEGWRPPGYGSGGHIQKRHFLFLSFEDMQLE